MVCFLQVQWASGLIGQMAVKGKYLEVQVEMENTLHWAHYQALVELTRKIVASAQPAAHSGDENFVLASPRGYTGSLGHYGLWPSESHRTRLWPT